jgi:putative phosphotransacetylase
VSAELIQSIVKEVVSEFQLNKENKEQSVPIGVSARHVHLSQEHVEFLFGHGYQLTPKSDLSQPSQFAANETVLLVGPKGSIERVRILGPARGATQVEVSKTDALKLGLKPPLRESGDIKDSSPVTIVGPKGSIYIPEGLILAQCHIHMTPEDAEYYGVENGEFVSVKVEGIRSVIFDRVLIRVSDKYKLEMHIDTDEGNAALAEKGSMGKILKPKA